MRNRQKKSSPISSSSSLKGLTEEIAQLGLDLDRNTVGPAVFALSAVSVFWLFYDGSVQTKQLKEELDARGVDSSLFNKLYELKYIKPWRWTLGTDRRTTKPRRRFSGNDRKSS